MALSLSEKLVRPLPYLSMWKTFGHPCPLFSQSTQREYSQIVAKWTTILVAEFDTMICGNMKLMLVPCNNGSTQLSQLTHWTGCRELAFIKLTRRYEIIDDNMSCVHFWLALGDMDGESDFKGKCIRQLLSFPS